MRLDDLMADLERSILVPRWYAEVDGEPWLDASGYVQLFSEATRGIAAWANTVPPHAVWREINHGTQYLPATGNRDAS